MTNGDIAAVLTRIATILELKGGENPFRVRAYSRAAQLIENLSQDLSSIHRDGGEDALLAMPGIGKDLAQKIIEMIGTGKLAYLAEIEKEIPKGLLEVLEIDGMGPKKTKFVWQTFKVHDIPSLRALAESGKLTDLKGWGEKSVANILRGIDQHARMSGRLPMHRAWEIAEEIVAALKKSKLCTQVEIAGSLRRRKETIGDIDILVTSSKTERVMDLFCTLPQVESITARGETKSTVFLKAGLDCDLRVVEDDVFGAALHYFTGSKEHNVHVRKLAVKAGVTISEYGVYKGTAEKKGKLIAARTEEDVFRTVGLPWIPPEIREDRGEVEAGFADTLPALIEEKDLQGDLHMHSSISDGSASIEDMAKAAKDLGLSYIAITDHASSMGMVKGIKEESIKDYLDRIEAARKKVKGIHILAGAEVDILEDGRLYLSDNALSQLDFTVASVHQYFHQSREEATARLVRVAKHPLVHVIGHPTARLLAQREGIDVDMEEVLKAAKKSGIAMELNASPERLDLNDVYCRRAKEMGVPVVIDSDAHSVNGLVYRYGIAQARRGWLTADDVLNALPWQRLNAWLQKRKA